VDSPGTRQTVEQKHGLKKTTVELAKELLLFPGQYTTFTMVILFDLLLLHYFNLHFILLKILFISIAVVTTLRVPFRIRREYHTLQRYDKIKRERS
jgi:hypothetical protein